jgi:pectin methylesterase-like acyl-CoA thioesterase
MISFQMMRFTTLIFLLVLGHSAASGNPFKTVGPRDADFTTVQAAIDAIPANNRRQKLILIQPGAYFGHTVLDKPFVTLRGAGPETLLTYNLGQAVPGKDTQPVGFHPRPQQWRLRSGVLSGYSDRWLRVRHRGRLHRH